jgi:hypothetical protein
MRWLVTLTATGATLPFGPSEYHHEPTCNSCPMRWTPAAEHHDHRGWNMSVQCRSNSANPPRRCSDWRHYTAYALRTDTRRPMSTPAAVCAALPCALRCTPLHYAALRCACALRCALRCALHCALAAPALCAVRRPNGMLTRVATHVNSTQSVRAAQRAHVTPVHVPRAPHYGASRY